MIAKAALITRRTAAGVSFVNDDVPLGRLYTVNAPGVPARWFDRETGRTTVRVSVWDVERGGWIPAELLRFLD